MKTLILAALKDKLDANEIQDLKVCYTGVGKVNAAIKTLQAIQKYSPDLIINFGTAGSLNPQLKGLIEVCSFYQRDMDASPLGFEIGQTPFEDEKEISFGRQGVSCGTGDKFVTSLPKLKTDIVDMEAFAIAKVCKLHNVDFRCFKFISDNADSEAKDDWVDNVSQGSSLFIEKLKTLNYL